MSIFFDCKHCGKCCGPVPVTKVELRKIKRAIAAMTPERVEELKNQKRKPMTCPMWDTQARRCSVYEARPEICKMQGYYEGLECPNNKGFATKSRMEGHIRIEESRGLSEIAGVLTIDYDWSNLV